MPFFYRKDLKSDALEFKKERKRNPISGTILLPKMWHPLFLIFFHADGEILKQWGQFHRTRYMGALINNPKHKFWLTVVLFLSRLWHLLSVLLCCFIPVLRNSLWHSRQVYITTPQGFISLVEFFFIFPLLQLAHFTSIGLLYWSRPRF